MRCNYSLTYPEFDGDGTRIVYQVVLTEEDGLEMVIYETLIPTKAVQTWVKCDLICPEGCEVRRMCLDSCVSGFMAGPSFETTHYSASRNPRCPAQAGVRGSSLALAVGLHQRLRVGRPPRHEDERIQVTEAMFTFVAIDDEGRPRPVPPA